MYVRSPLTNRQMDYLRPNFLVPTVDRTRAEKYLLEVFGKLS